MIRWSRRRILVLLTIALMLCLAFIGFWAIALFKHNRSLGVDHRIYLYNRHDAVFLAFQFTFDQKLDLDIFQKQLARKYFFWFGDHWWDPRVPSPEACIAGEVGQSTSNMVAICTGDNSLEIISLMDILVEGKVGETPGNLSLIETRREYKALRMVANATEDTLKNRKIQYHLVIKQVDLKAKVAPAAAKDPSA